MAHSLSAKKRVRQNAKRKTINRARKSQVKTQIKHLEAAFDQGDVQAAGGGIVCSRYVGIGFDGGAAVSAVRHYRLL